MYRVTGHCCLLSQHLNVSTSQQQPTPSEACVASTADFRGICVRKKTSNMVVADITFACLVLCCLLQLGHSFTSLPTDNIPYKSTKSLPGQRLSVGRNRLSAVIRRPHFASPERVSPVPQLHPSRTEKTSWGPLQALVDNPIVRVFDEFQSLVQHSAVSTRNFLHGQGAQQAYGTTIVAMTVLAHLVTAPLSFYEKKAAQRRNALSRRVEEVRRQYPDKPELQRRLIDHITGEAETNSVLSFLALYAPILLFMALYRSVNGLVTSKAMREPFLWIPDLQGPVYDTAPTDWLTKWQNFQPLLGWKDTASFLSIPALLYAAQTLSLAAPTNEQTSPQPLNLLSYSLTLSSFTVPAGLGLYWLVNNVVGTVSSAAVKALVDSDPFAFDEQQLQKIVADYDREKRAADWGYRSEEDVFAEARRNFQPSRSPVLPTRESLLT